MVAPPPAVRRYRVATNQIIHRVVREDVALDRVGSRRRAAIASAVSQPHIVPRPAPPWPSDTGVQWAQETA